MAIYGDGGASQRAADAAAAEAARQAEAERQRLADEATAAKAEADRRAADEAARQQAQLDQQKADAEAMRQQLTDQAAATLAAQQKIEDQRKAERDADLKRQADERAAAEAKAASNAKALTDYSTNRQTLVDNARTKVEGAFAPYDDNFYGDYAKKYADYYQPQLDQQFNDAKRAATFNFANKGTLNSTAAARAFGRLGQERTQAGADIAQNAQTAAASFRGNVDSQRQSLLSSIFGASAAAPPITVDNIGDANTSLKGLTTALTSPVSLAQSAASTLTPPAYNPLNNPFSLPSNAAPRTVTVAGSGANGAYTTSRGTSGRLVN